MLAQRLATLACCTLLTLGLVVATPAFAAEAGARAYAAPLSIGKLKKMSLRTIVVAPWGSDSNGGSPEAPKRTIEAGLRSVATGGTLLVRGGEYHERIINPTIARGTADSRISVKAYPGEAPVLKGLLWLTNADYWTISGLTVTWSDQNDRSEQMVKMISGRGWVFSGNTLIGARSYAALLVAGNANDWNVRDNLVRDTYASNGINQDHLVYVNSFGVNGVVENNVLTNSPNGQAIKVGPSGAGYGSVTGGLKIRYNTMSDNLGPSNVQLSHQTSNVEIYRNLLVRPAAGRPAVFSWELTGRNNVVHDNAYWQANGAVITGVPGLTDTGGNVELDPSSPAAASYGAVPGS